jgi:hypothetical protein
MLVPYHDTVVTYGGLSKDRSRTPGAIGAHAIRSACRFTRRRELAAAPLPSAAVIAGWILEENLRPFLECLGTQCGYDFDPDDWTAVDHGLLRADPEPGAPEVVYTYALIGKRTIELDLAFEPGAGVVSYQLRADTELEVRADAIASVAACFVLIHTRAASRHVGPT